MAARATRRGVVMWGSLAILLLAGLAALNAFSLQSIKPESPEQILIYYGLSVVAFLLFVLVLVLLVRNVLKLYAEQRSRVLGTRLRTRMLWGALLVSLVPIVFMILWSYGLMNRSVDRWFSQPVADMRDDANDMATKLAAYVGANARSEADSIAATLPVESLAQEKVSDIDAVMLQHETTLQGGFVVVYRGGRTIASYDMPMREARVKEWMPPKLPAEDESQASPVVKKLMTPPSAPSGADAVAAMSMNAAILEVAERNDAPIVTVGQKDYALGRSPVKGGATVVAGLPLPDGLARTMARMRQSTDAYWKLFRGRRELRNLYLILLAMITCLALFASSWLALHLSKQVTKPVESLADAMQAVAAGDYAKRVDEGSTDEMSELIRSFNLMAGDLESSRAQVDQSTVALNAVNRTLEARRSELETMLETIPNGVATLDATGRVVLANRALSEMMDPGGQRPFIGLSMAETFPAEMLEVLERLMRRSHRMGSASGEMELGPGAIAGGSGTMNLLVTVALLEGEQQGAAKAHQGYVIVLENATELLRAQKQSAWKEVARRVAHEIKNPLTPISLSAEQIRRHIDRLGGVLEAEDVQSPSVAVIKRCSEVITSSVESMRGLVDQFSSLAEFPTAKPRPADLNTIVENSLALFAGRLQAIRIVKRMAVGLPLVMADPEAMKRALGNLIDNAAEAMQKSLVKEIRVETCLLESGMIELTVADSGSGLTDDLRERLFLPYFSTKQRGTGLGLAIAAKIVQEHQGTIRAEGNVPAGAKFIIELKPASMMEAVASDSGQRAAVVGGKG